MGAGDISADPDTATTADLATSELMLQAGPATVFTAGDNQYPRGELEDFTDPDGYAGSWGRVALKRKTCPAVGNHEYADPRRGPAGYLAYFSPPVLSDRTSSTRAPAKAPSSPPCTPTVRRPDRVGGAYGLDSQCTHAREAGPSCARNSNQLNWFRAHLAAHAVKCRIVFYHHPRFGNGAPYGDDAKVHWLHAVAAYAGRASLIINGHSHAYERFTSMTASGTVDGSFTAPRSVTVGTGGPPDPVLEGRPVRYPLPRRRPSRRAPDHPRQGLLDVRVRPCRRRGGRRQGVRRLLTVECESRPLVRCARRVPAP